MTYELCNKIGLKHPHAPWMKRQSMVWETLWWPAHRPCRCMKHRHRRHPDFKYLAWAQGIPQTNAGDLKMVTEWPRLSFVVRNPLWTAGQLDQASPLGAKYLGIERNKNDESA